MTALETRLLSLQQQLQQLNTEISTLLAGTSSNQPVTNEVSVSKTTRQLAERKFAISTKPAVGINRYRQLQTNEQADLTDNYPERSLSGNSQR